MANAAAFWSAALLRRFGGVGAGGMPLELLMQPDIAAKAPRQRCTPKRKRRAVPPRGGTAF